MKSEQINELATALAKAQAEMHGAKKDSKNPFFKSSYADLQSVWDACRDVLTKNGLSVVQFVDSAEYKGLYLNTILLHSSGQWIESSYPLEPVKKDPQGMGSAISYARRYSLAAMVGVYQTDDDAEIAQGRINKEDPAKTYFDPIPEDLPPFDSFPDKDDYKPTYVPVPTIQKPTEKFREEAKKFSDNMTKEVAKEPGGHIHRWRDSKTPGQQYCTMKLPNGEYCKVTQRG